MHQIGIVIGFKIALWPKSGCDAGFGLLSLRAVLAKSLANVEDIRPASGGWLTTRGGLPDTLERPLTAAIATYSKRSRVDSARRSCADVRARPRFSAPRILRVTGANAQSDGLTAGELGQRVAVERTGARPYTPRLFRPSLPPLNVLRKRG